jgi:uncharacterized Zn ribbon protein
MKSPSYSPNNIYIMKLLTVFALALFFAFAPQTPLKAQEVAAPEGEIIEVYYFHYTRRCVTCRIVEKETENAINEHFPEMAKEGKIVYMKLNLEEGDNLTLANQLGVSGQTLLVKNGEKMADITNRAFMTVRNTERLKNEVKTAIEGVM